MQEKRTSWEEMYQHFLLVTDALGKPIDKGILDTVVAFNVLGFRTTMSCEVHLNRGIAAPWIDLIPEGAKTLRDQIRDAQATVLADEHGVKPDGKEEKELRIQLKVKQYLLLQSLVALFDEFYMPSRKHVHYDTRLIPNCSAAGRIRVASLGSDLQEIVSMETRAQKLHIY